MSENEIEVMFLKECAKCDNLFVVNDKDVAFVPFDQVKAVLPPPVVIVKGCRVFYKFSKI